MEQLQDIRSMTQRELTAEFAALGQPAYRAKQVFSWLQKSGVQSFDEMTNISKALRQELAQRYYIANAGIAQRL
ncbi:MAG: 23S rRNA (adenine(2503)-C(2))-methyltransferase RlmN, partial [Ruminococcaceae bacterium]|nr:23S rRNA (adenine(2503)-C(2))-methyltransferase RlmN [Oscillospiraceae bacterium]